MKAIIKLLLVAIVCLTACNKDSYTYIIEGRIIDKITKEPVSGILVSFFKYDTIPSTKAKIQKYSPREYEDWSDENGKFNASSNPCYPPYTPSTIYFYDNNGIYKDTIIRVDFSNVSLSGTPAKNYKGDFVLNIGDIELEKMN